MKEIEDFNAALVALRDKVADSHRLATKAEASLKKVTGDTHISALLGLSKKVAQFDRYPHDKDGGIIVEPNITLK